jgi:hypothetical protein
MATFPRKPEIEAVADPLLEQMNSLHLFTPLQRPRQGQTLQRRSSDPDRRNSGQDLIALHAPITTVRSSDGSRWLPAPKEQAHRYGGPWSTDCAIIATNVDSDAGLASIEIPQHKCDAPKCSVSQVFGTVELLEIILGFLRTKDVLAQRLTSVKWNVVVTDSPQLRLHFFAIPQFLRPGPDFLLLPLNVAGLSIELGESIHLGQWICVSMSREAARKILPNVPAGRVRSRSIFEGLRGGLGSRAGSSDDKWPRGNTESKPTHDNALDYSLLFITQPPPVNVQAFIHQSGISNDAKDDESYPAACAKLSCTAGITLGFLAEAALSLLPSVTGAATTDTIVFKAILSFCSSKGSMGKRSVTRQITRIESAPQEFYR